MFPEYHKINGLYKRDDKGNFTGEFARDEFEYLYYNEWLFTEKVDGTNIRIGTDINDTTTPGTKIGGRTANAQIPTFLLPVLEPIAKRLEASDVCREDDGTMCDVTLYGEGFGPKIQKGGGNYGDEVRFVLFDVQISGWWLKREDVEDVGARLGLDVVPIVGELMLQDAEELCRAGFDSHWGNFIAEGVVGTPAVPLHARDGSRIITKLKYKDYDHVRRDRQLVAA
jgi:hypothetical protein